MHFQEDDKKSLPVLFQPSWKCQNTIEDLIFLHDKEVRKSRVGLWRQLPILTNALWFKARGIVKNNIILTESKAGAFENLWLHSEHFAIYAFKTIS